MHLPFMCLVSFSSVIAQSLRCVLRAHPEPQCIFYRFVFAPFRICVRLFRLGSRLSQFVFIRSSLMCLFNLCLVGTRTLIAHLPRLDLAQGIVANLCPILILNLLFRAVQMVQQMLGMLYSYFVFPVPQGIWPSLPSETLPAKWGI